MKVLFSWEGTELPKVLQIGTIRLSRSKQTIIVSFEGGVSGFARVGDILALIDENLEKVPVRTESWLGVPASELKEMISARTICAERGD